ERRRLGTVATRRSNWPRWPRPRGHRTGGCHTTLLATPTTTALKTIEQGASMRRSTPIRSLAAGVLALTLACGAVARGSDDDTASTDTPEGEVEAPEVGAGSDEGALADLVGKRIGVQSDTTGQDYAEANKPEGAEIVAFDDTV